MYYLWKGDQTLGSACKELWDFPDISKLSKTLSHSKTRTIILYQKLSPAYPVGTKPTLKVALCRYISSAIVLT